ncbi:hypothetical protein SDC9_200156 [bioreactor metagenome]|uniref:Uncharacterized protein n=1 Tax=bioreactor metagenome TaxID=1076179 RepID=A0A645IVR2_9ZZZZ
MVARVKGGISAAINHQIAVQNALGIRARRSIERSAYAMLGAEAVQAQGNCVELRVGSWAEQLMRVMFEENHAGVQRHSFYAPYSALKAGLRDMLGQSLAQIGQIGRHRPIGGLRKGETDKSGEAE